MFKFACLSSFLKAIVDENVLPVARAGGDRSVVQGSSLVLDSAGSTDSDGTIQSVRWLIGASVVSTASTFSVDTSAIGSRVVRLEVTDDRGGVDFVDTRITVTEATAAPANVAPVARAGGNRSLTVGETLTLTSRNSTDSDGTIVSVSWTESGSEIGVGETINITATAAGERTIRLRVTDDDGATDTVDTVISISAASQSENGYITARSRTPEHSYLDYSGGIGSPVVRRRILRFGANVAELDAAIDYTHIVEPEPNVTAINAAIDQVSARARGGVVRPKAIASMPIRDIGVTLKDKVVYDGERIEVHDVRGDFAEATQAFSAENFAILNVTTNADGESCYAVRMDDCRNAVIQDVDADKHGSDSIRLQKQNRDITVRYCRISSERDEDGGTTHRNQHGIVSASAGDQVSEHPNASTRFGIVYSTGIAIYSNYIQHTDGHAIDSHASNVECMGNYIDDCAFGCKFPHADNVAVHHNRFGGARSLPDNDDPWAIRLFSNNEYLELSGGREGHVGYAGDRVFIAHNRFEDTATRTDIRVEHMHGESWFLENEFQPNGTKYQFGTLGDAASRYYHSGQDSTVTAARSDAYDARWLEETDADVIALDPAAIVALMRRPRTQADWHSYSHAPLPEVLPFDGDAGAPPAQPDSLDAPVLESATPTGTGAIRVVHTAVAGATDYMVQSRIGTGQWTVAVIEGSLTHDIGGLAAGTAYEFRVLARDTSVNPGLQSAFSNTLSATTEAAASGVSFSDPAEGATLAGATQRFRWNRGSDSTVAFDLHLSEQPFTDTYRLGEVYDSQAIGAVGEITADGIPTDGSAIYARLMYSKPGGDFGTNQSIIDENRFVDREFVARTIAPPPPADGVKIVMPAVGYGSNSEFGDNGEVIRVTNLNNSGPGSFRAAVEASGPRRVVIDVEGVVQVPTEIHLNNPFITIDGSSAPGEGLKLQATPGNSGFVMTVTTTDFFIHNIGMYHNTGTGNVDNRDVLNISKTCRRGTVSQCTFMWGTDETVSVFHSGSDIQDITIQYCLIAESLDNAGHSKGRHPKGMIVSRGLTNITLHHNYFVANGQRNPRFDGMIQVLNNIVITSGGDEFRGLSFGDEDPNRVNEYDIMHNRVYGVQGRHKGGLVYPEKLQNSGKPLVYAKGNIHDRARSSPSQPEDDFFGTWEGAPAENLVLADSPLHPTSPDICTHTDVHNDNLLDFLRLRVGATAWNRSSNDQRVMNIQPDQGLRDAAIQLY